MTHDPTIRQKKTRSTHSSITYNSVATILKEAQRLVDDHGLTLDEIIVEMEGGYDSEYPCLTYTTMETDEEYASRQKTVKEYAEHRRRQYEQLKREFGE